MYYFVAWEQTECGWSPVLPEGVGFVLLAEPAGRASRAGFGLFQCDLPEDFQKSEAVRPVPGYLFDLLESARDYPPAMALARDEVARGEPLAENAFAQKLGERLRHHLSGQAASPFFLAKAVKTQTGYKYSGGYYWIVGYRGQLVFWVSRDYYVYQDPIEEFEIEASELQLRFGRSG